MPLRRLATTAAAASGATPMATATGSPATAAANSPAPTHQRQPKRAGSMSRNASRQYSVVPMCIGP